MCGRFTNRFSWKELHERLDLIGTPLNLRPRYNVAPSQDVAVARAAPDGRTLAMLRWGLIPAWALCGVPHNAHDVDSTVMWADLAVSLFSKGLMANHFT